MSDFNAARSRAKRPCPLWVDAFQRDTQHLEADEVGAYMLILMAMWTRESCDFPNDDSRLARVSRVSIRLWKSRIGPVIRAFLRVESGAVISDRLRKEAAYTERQVTQQSDRKKGEKSGKALINNNQGSTTDTTTAPSYPTTQLPNSKKERVSNETLVHFDAFWAVWPVKIAKADAVKAWAKLSQPDRLVATENAKAFFERWQRAYPTANPIHPARYLNGKRWLDEISLKSIEGGRNGQPATKSEERMGAFLKGAAIP